MWVNKKAIDMLWLGLAWIRLSVKLEVLGYSREQGNEKSLVEHEPSTTGLSRLID